jgi:hypothetical protein
VEENDVNQSVDDVLKLEPTAEMDDFHKMLNEFEDEVLTDKVEVKEEKTSQPDEKVAKKVKAKKVNGDAEGEPVKKKIGEDGKRLRKKVKVKSDNKENQDVQDGDKVKAVNPVVPTFTPSSFPVPPSSSLPLLSLVVCPLHVVSLLVIPPSSSSSLPRSLQTFSPPSLSATIPLSSWSSLRSSPLTTTR